MADESASEFHPDLQWLQTARRVELFSTLRGHVVAVLFWRTGCIHSAHAFADLAALAADLRERPFAVVAVHTPQHEAERDPDRVRAFLQQHGAPVAVALDPDRLAFRAFKATGWPSLVLVDAQGQVRFRGRGEPRATALRDATEALLAEGLARGTVAPVPFTAVPEVPPRTASGLAFPTHLRGSPDGTLWLADTGHHRILEIDPDTFTVRRAFGDGAPGHRDGDAATARFARPAGLLPLGDRVLVADPGNHTLRELDPRAATVRTVCGTGRRTIDAFGGGFGESQGLCSPVDLCHDGTTVRFAQAGGHQLWTFAPDTQAAMVWLGTGSQATHDGSEDASFTQPLCVDAGPRTLWVGEGSGTLRRIDLAHDTVATAVRDLGRPAAILCQGDDVLVADAFRGEVLRIVPGEPQPVRIAGREHGLSSPSGLCLLGRELLVVDAGRHAIFALDLDADDPAATIRERTLTGVPPVAEATLDAAVTMGEVSLCAFADVTLWLRPPADVAARWPNGTRVALRVCNDDGVVLVSDLDREAEVAGGRVRIDTVPIAEPGRGVLRLDLRGPLGPEGEAADGPVRLRCLLPVRAAGDGSLEARVDPVARG